MAQGAARVSPQDPGNVQGFTLTMPQILEKSCAARAKGQPHIVLLYHFTTLQLLPRLLRLKARGRRAHVSMF
eukprot:4734646-Prymnesium_polylepis.1